MTNSNNILKANKIGLGDRDGFICFDCPVFNVAYELGQDGIDLAQCKVVKGWRYGKNDNGVSFNFRDQRPEKGLSLMAIDREEENAASIFINPNKKKYSYEGILLPFRGSDGEPLILPFGIEQYEI